jgi:hypothetical protein
VNAPVLNVIVGAAPDPSIYLTNDDRREWCTVLDGALASMRLTPEQISAAPAGSVAPAGAFLAVVPAAVWWLVGGISVSGIASYAAFAWGVRDSAQATERVRIQEAASVALRQSEVQGRLDAMIARMNAEHAQGRTIPPSPIEGQPLTAPRGPLAPPPSAVEQAIEALKETGIAVGGLAAGGIFFAALVGAAERYMARRDLRAAIGATR